MTEERETVVGHMYTNNPMHIPVSLLCSSNKVYSESVYGHFRSNKATSQELRIFACGMTLRRAVYNHTELEKCMLFESHTSNAIVLWLKRFSLLY